MEVYLYQSILNQDPEMLKSARHIMRSFDNPIEDYEVLNLLIESLASEFYDLHECGKGITLALMTLAYEYDVLDIFYECFRDAYR